MLKFFVSACLDYGIPSRLRTDRGKENGKVALFLNLVQGIDRRSHIAGKSVHNQRIERLWGDVYQQAVEPFYSAFYGLEDDEDIALDINSRLDICAL